MRVTAKPKAPGAAAAAVDVLATKTVRKGVRKGVSDSSKLLLAAAKAGVPEDTKTLKKALGRALRSYQGGANVTAIVGARKDAAGKPPKFTRTVRRKGYAKQSTSTPANYVLLVEKGTQAHALGKGSRKTARRKGGKTSQTGKMHPGARPDPFLERAMDATRGACEKLTRDAVAQAVVQQGAS